jgi:hypothetical protein
LTNGGFVLPTQGVSLFYWATEMALSSCTWTIRQGLVPRVPWKIKFRDYLAYVLISLGVVGAVLLIALYEAHKAR